MNILIWLQAIGGLFVLLLAVFFVGSIALDSLREFLWKANQSKRETIRVDLARDILELSNWVYGDTKEGYELLRIVGTRLNDNQVLISDLVRDDFRRAMEAQSDQP